MCACYVAVATSKTGTHALKEDHGEQSHGTAFQEPAAMTTPALAHHHLPEYDGERDNWRAYVIKAEAYFEATGVTDTARKRALLVAALNTDCADPSGTSRSEETQQSDLRRSSRNTG